MTLRRALWMSCATLTVLGAIAFWPRPAWQPPVRPPLRAPIVFDELVQQSSPPGTPPLPAGQ